MKSTRKAKLPLLQLSVIGLALASSVGCTAMNTAHAEPDRHRTSVDYGTYEQAELDSLLAPIALYPDSLLSHILIAATYPLEVVQAERWLSEREHLSPEQALAAADEEAWDPSVKALVATPDVLRRMSEDLEWTQAVGEAFIAQQEDVLASIQLLRDRAYVAGNLRGDDDIKVVREPQQIRIETVRTEYVYVPVYDARYVYGPWWHHSMPVYWSRPGLTVSIGSGIRWSFSYHVPSWYFFSDFYWPSRHVVVHHHHYYERDRRDRWDRRYRPHPRDGERWRHDPRHRRNVDYRHPDLVRNPPRYSDPDDRVVGAPVERERPPQVEIRRRLLEAEAQPIMRRSETPTRKYAGEVEQKPVRGDVRQQPVYERERKEPVMRQQPVRAKPEPRVVRQQPRFERKEPIMRQQPAPVVRQPAPVARQPVQMKQQQPVMRQQPARPVKQPVAQPSKKARDASSID
jgi:hypothetical protein